MRRNRRRRHRNLSVQPNNPLINLNPQQVGYQLPAFPTEPIYTYRAARLRPGTNVYGTADNPMVTYIPQRLEHIKGKGNFVYYYGVDLPSKTFAPVEAIYAMQPIKRRLINIIRLFTSKDGLYLLLGLLVAGTKRRHRLLGQVLQYFNEESDMTATPWYLDDYYCNTVREIIKGIKVFLKEIGVEESIGNKTAEIIGMTIEYDNAYRYPIQDALAEALPYELIHNFPKELNRLIGIINERDHRDDTNSVKLKFQKAGRLMKLARHLPKIRKAIKKAIKAMDWENLKLDESDIYHTLLYNGYDMKGVSLAQRFTMYQAIHGPDINKWPPRIGVKKD